MEQVYRRCFSCLNDFERVNNFLSKTYDCDEFYNWDNARWSFNRYCIHNKEELSENRLWENSVQLWEDINGDIVAVAHIEEPGDYFFQVHPSYKYLEEEMLIWAIENCKKYYPNLNKIVVSSSVNDKERKKLYSKYQAVMHDFVDENRTVELTKEYSIPQLPDSYKIINLESGSLDACKRISDLYTHIWPTSIYMPKGETVASMTKSVAYKKELSFIIVDDKDQYVAFTVVWVDSLNNTAHFYPVAIDPNYLNMNLLEVMLKNALNELIVLGYNNANIAAWYREEEEEVFEKIGFRKNDFKEIYDIMI